MNRPELRAEGFVVHHVLAMGEPADEIIKFVHTHSVDLIAMSTHGHRFIPGRGSPCRINSDTVSACNFCQSPELLVVPSAGQPSR